MGLRSVTSDSRVVFPNLVSADAPPAAIAGFGSLPQNSYCNKPLLNSDEKALCLRNQVKPFGEVVEVRPKSTPPPKPRGDEQYYDEFFRFHWLSDKDVPIAAKILGTGLAIASAPAVILGGVTGCSDEGMVSGSQRDSSVNSRDAKPNNDNRDGDVGVAGDDSSSSGDGNAPISNQDAESLTPDVPSFDAALIDARTPDTSHQADVTPTDSHIPDVGTQTDATPPAPDACLPTDTPDNTCNNQDDNCNGIVDEDYEGPPVTCGIGACENEGVSFCVDGVEENVCRPNPPRDEVCDGVDNNCDNTVDEEIVSDLQHRRISDNDVLFSKNPTSFWNGEGYDLFWHQRQNADANQELFLRKMNPCGESLGQDINIASTEGLNVSDYAILPSNGGGYGIAWISEDWSPANRGRGAIYFAQLDNNGQKLGDDTIVADINDGYRNIRNLYLFQDDNGFGIFWTNSAENVYLTRLDPNGQKLGDELVIDTEHVQFTGNFSVVQNDNGYGMVWISNEDVEPNIPGIETYNVHFTRLNLDGERLIDDVNIATYNAPYRIISPRLFWMNNGYGLFWEGMELDDRHVAIHRNIYFAQLDVNGNKVGEDSRVASDDGPFFAGGGYRILPSGDTYSLFWGGSEDEERAAAFGVPDNLYFSKLGANGEIRIDAVELTPVSDLHSTPSVTWNDEEYGISWIDPTGYVGGIDSEVYFMRIDDGGNVIENRRRISPISWDIAISPLRLLWNTSGYGVFYHEENWWNNPHAYLNFMGLRQYCSFECMWE